ncbi:T9SS type A sorting domain-containing protein [Chryseobacterium sp. SN22]|uniref:T9SS type A sorting domain-containing protein n=1 Tax=Chryseobacterium sp. SN22 TaxID=2606431 RepID=UPI0011EC48D4|nr:T9SS type A sorting domain-containing protein [Chryseobacterium sp. SN22]KAA0130745.1 T9SS type A sorting domain-containing protein [Chryseobacterium sp. SN22]
MKLRLLLGSLMFTAAAVHAQVAMIDENFESAIVSSPVNYNNLVNGWIKKTTVNHNIYVDKNTTTNNQYAQFYAAGSLSTDVFLVSPQIIAPDGSKKITFTVTPTGGSTLEVGLIDDPSNLIAGSGVPASYQLLQSFTFTETAAETTVSPITVPASTKQYIVFRFRNPLATFPGSSHSALAVDNVKYNNSSILSTSDQAKPKDEIRFAVNADNTALEFIAKKNPKNIQVYSAGGRKVAAGTLSGRSFDISTLQTGVYYLLIETAEGAAVKSKFVKK